MIESLLKQECDLQFFHNNGYIRKKCKSCGAYFWTLDTKAEVCGDQPCTAFSFINNPITKYPLTLTEVRHKFLSYFEKNNHSRLQYPVTGERCPVIARWRTDIYLTIASIADFQPHVTSGEVPPPKNPLVISQPCIRLNDLEEVGVSGRHLTMFEMMGHHAFNKKRDEIYWKEETVAYCDEFFQKEIGIPREQINYKEHLWIGGGNAGPCIEVLAGGLEIATLVFMNMKEDAKGTTSIEEKTYSRNPLNIVDTGYGLERIAWYTQGTPTIYETAFLEIVTFLREMTSDNTKMKYIYALADHSKCLAFMLGDGIVPSNVKAGYLARLIIRRSLRFLEKLKIKISLATLVEMQLKNLAVDFPSLSLGKDQILEMLELETKKYSDTLTKGEGLIKRFLKEHKTIDANILITFYDTHGMPPDLVQRIAKKERVTVSIPNNFDSMIAELHSRGDQKKEEEISETTFPQTQLLYYDNHYAKEFKAKVVWKKVNDMTTEVILDKTVFYPEGGGQPGDIGTLATEHQVIKVIEVKKQDSALIHVLDQDIALGQEVIGRLDWDHRYTLMKHHTGTHVVNGALRKVLGEHIWQAGSQLGLSEARFDFSHYKNITENQLKTIERYANEFIQQQIAVEKRILERNDAERKYGFRLYQGGVPPGNIIRTINIPGIDVEACGGTHLNNIKEIEKIRILKAERIQDGVNRVVFAAGKIADSHLQQDKKLYDRIIHNLKDIYDIKQQDDISNQLRKTATNFSVPVSQLEKTIDRFKQETSISKRIKVKNLKEATDHLFTEWKQSQKQKKRITTEEIQRLQKIAETIPGTTIKVISATTHYEGTTTAGAITTNPDYVIHLYDGNKITSSASENVSIDLREIAPEIGKILGGSGGGKPKLTQCGGPRKEKINKALEEAKHLTFNYFKKKK